MGELEEPHSRDGQILQAQVLKQRSKCSLLESVCSAPITQAAKVGSSDGIVAASFLINLAENSVPHHLEPGTKRITLKMRCRKMPPGGRPGDCTKASFFTPFL